MRTNFSVPVSRRQVREHLQKALEELAVARPPEVAQHHLFREEADHVVQARGVALGGGAVVGMARYSQVSKEGGSARARRGR